MSNCPLCMLGDTPITMSYRTIITRSGLALEVYPSPSKFKKILDQKSAAKYFKIPVYEVQTTKRGWKNPRTGEVINRGVDK